MKIAAIIVVVWLVIGVIAAAQRDYFGGGGKNTDCAKTGDTALTIIAGPLNYVGVNPKVKCKVPQPSK
ncbi:MAG: hypothetical protein ABJA81_01440 [Nocardioidaceae bacterium]